MSNRLAHRAGRLDLRLPPERPGQPMHVHIEIVLRANAPARRVGLGLIWWLLFGLILWSVLA